MVRPTIEAKECIINNCCKKHYAKGYCRKHYAYYISRKDKAHRKKCANPTCMRNTTKEYCRLCFLKIKNRQRRGISYNKTLSKDLRSLCLSGEGNINWNGGISEYQRHYDFKKARVKVLRENNYICKICGDVATEVHHKDGSKNNHTMPNLIPLCKKCHKGIFHNQKHKTSKFLRKYGYSREELSKILNFSVAKVLSLHYKNKLYTAMENFSYDKQNKTYQ